MFCDSDPTHGYCLYCGIHLFGAVTIMFSEHITNMLQHIIVLVL